MSLVSAVLRNTETGYMHWCPGCHELHHIPVSGQRAWKFDGDVDAPTFSPSVRHSWGKFVGETWVKNSDICHYFIRGGQIEFCADSTHALAGKTVALPPVPGAAA